MITKNIKIDGSGDSPSISVAIADFLLGLDNTSISPTETLLINLVDVGDYDAVFVGVFVNQLVQSKITITTLAGNWQQARIVQQNSVWFDWDTIFLNSYINLEIHGCGLVAAGVFLQNHDQDVLIKNCITYGTGLLVNSQEGQVVIEQVIGDPLDVILNGTPTRAARDVNGGNLTFTREGLIVSYARLGHVQTNKPANITHCTNCDGYGFGLSSYTETSTGNSPTMTRSMLKKIGSFLDNVALNFGIIDRPLLTIVEGGLYRRLVLGSNLAAADELIRINNANSHMVCIDRCRFYNATFGIRITGYPGVVYATNNVLKDITEAKIRIEACPWTGRVFSKNNRGFADDVVNGCLVDCCGDL